jgi:hypothetical protein
MSRNSKWWGVLTQLAREDKFSLFCIDKAHVVAQQGWCFCPEFIEAIKNIDVLFHLSSIPSPRIAMSATMANGDLDLLLNFVNIERLNPSLKILWMKMCWWTVCFDANVSRSANMSVSNCLLSDYILRFGAHQSDSKTCKSPRMSLDTEHKNTNAIVKPLIHMSFCQRNPPNKLLTHLSPALLFCLMCNNSIKNRGLQLNPRPFSTC